MQHMQNVNVYKVGFEWSSLLLFILGITSRETKPNVEVGLLSTYTNIWGQQDFLNIIQQGCIKKLKMTFKMLQKTSTI